MSDKQSPPPSTVPHTVFTHTVFTHTAAISLSDVITAALLEKPLAAPIWNHEMHRDRMIESDTYAYIVSAVTLHSRACNVVADGIIFLGEPGSPRTLVGVSACMPEDGDLETATINLYAWHSGFPEGEEHVLDNIKGNLVAAATAVTVTEFDLGED